MVEPAHGHEQQTAAWVKDGILNLRHQEGGPYPLLRPCSGLELLVNGRICTDTTVVKISDQVELKPVNEQVTGSWRLEVSKDRQRALVYIQPHLLLERQVADLPPGNVLQLAVTEKHITSAPVELEALKDLLRQKGIVAGIDWEACLAAAKITEAGELVIAQGTLPQPGLDARVELLFNLEAKTLLDFAPDDPAARDYRQRFDYTSIAAGAVLARKIPSKPGRPGQDILGTELPPTASQDVQLAAGHGVVISDDGLEAIALRSGRPFAKQRRTQVILSVLDLLEVDEDIGLQTGNVKFDGDVWISGNITEGMHVEAGGAVRLLGYMTEASVTAGGPVTILGNVLSSIVMAGGTPVLVKEIINIVNSIRLKLEELAQALTQLQKHPDFAKLDWRTNLGPAIQFFLEGKYRDLPGLVNKIDSMAVLLPVSLGKEAFSGFCRQMRQQLLISPLALKNGAVIARLVADAVVLEDSYAEVMLEPADLVVSYAQNSTLIATGNLRIDDAGAYHSQLWAGGKVVITNYCRGGKIRAGGDTWIGELGAPAAVLTSVKVPAHSWVAIKLAWENARVQVGNRVYHFSQQEQNVRLALDREGLLQVEHLTRFELNLLRQFSRSGSGL